MEEKVSERMIIRGTPQHCYEVLSAFEAYPEWAADIKSVSIDDRDDQGRATRGHLPRRCLWAQYLLHLALRLLGRPGRTVMAAGRW